MPCPHSGQASDFGGVRTRPVTGAQKPETRVQALVASAFPMGKLGLRQGGARDLGAAASPPPPYPQEAERGVNSRLRPALTLDEPRIGGGSGPDLEARAPPWGNPCTGSSFLCLP